MCEYTVYKFACGDNVCEPFRARKCSNSETSWHQTKIIYKWLRVLYVLPDGGCKKNPTNATPVDFPYMPHPSGSRTTGEGNAKKGQARESKATRSTTSSNSSKNDVGAETWYVEDRAAKVVLSRPDPLSSLRLTIKWGRGRSSEPLSPKPRPRKPRKEKKVICYFNSMAWL
jgi:hypothetical protein